MSTPRETAALQQLKPLCRPLHEALQHGAERSHRIMRSEGLLAAEHNWLRHHHARVQAGEYLRRNSDDIAPWNVLPNQPTGSLQLVNGSSTIRVLRPLVGELPAPGRNGARRAYYVQPPLTGLTLDATVSELEISRFIGIWEVLDEETFEVGIRVYRTTGVFQIGSSSRADLSFWLPNEADELDSLTFEPSDADIELPLAEEESGDKPLHG